MYVLLLLFVLVVTSLFYDFFFLFNDTATTEIYTYWHTLSLHDALPIWLQCSNWWSLQGARPSSTPSSPPSPLIFATRAAKPITNRLLIVSRCRRSACSMGSITTTPRLPTSYRTGRAIPAAWDEIGRAHV